MGVLPNHPFLGYSTPHFRKPAYMAYHLPRLFYNDPPHLRAERACRFRRTGNPGEVIIGLCHGHHENPKRIITAGMKIGNGNIMLRITTGWWFQLL